MVNVSLAHSKSGQDEDKVDFILSGNERDNNFTSSMHELFRLLTPLLSLKFYFNTEKIQIHSGNNRPLLVLQLYGRCVK